MPKKNQNDPIPIIWMLKWSVNWSVTERLLRTNPDKTRL
jgi:hypothetical protein